MTIIAAENRFRHQSLLSILISKNIISKDQAKIVELESQHQNIDTKESLKRLGFCPENLIQEILSEQSSTQQIDLNEVIIDSTLLKHFPKKIAQKYKIIPISLEQDTLTIACTDPSNIIALDQIHIAFPNVKYIQSKTTKETDLSQAIWNYYEHDFDLGHILEEINKKPLKPEDLSYDNPIVRLVDILLFDAIKLKASDIHFEPEYLYIRIRYRIDGVLSQKLTLHKTFWSALVVRLKILAGLDIAESRKPQSGRFSKVFCDREIDLRTSCHPTIHGENIVLRILDKKNALRPLNELGFLPNQIKTLRKITQRPGGINIITGPTGSGKTTTLYALLNYISSLDVNIMTLEQPIEYKLPLIRQTEIPESSYISYADAIRSILRQDPDIIYIGEIRDEESAKMAMRAAMTGHQVYTTLHTNTALGALQRLQDLGISNTELEDNISSIMAQRLVRKLCSRCKVKIKDFYQATGCYSCHGTGFNGRLPIAEIIVFDFSQKKENICKNIEKYKNNLQENQKVNTFYANSILLLNEGLTTPQEIKKVIGDL
jgi:type II secretory ATPase GspE/PulE/Tfp pilus assembly ATPase PilB-like protein